MKYKRMDTTDPDSQHDIKAFFDCLRKTLADLNTAIQTDSVEIMRLKVCS